MLIESKKLRKFFIRQNVAKMLRNMLCKMRHRVLRKIWHKKICDAQN